MLAQHLSPRHIHQAMAYINCPQCGQSALSVATRCPRCGFGFTQHRLRHGHHRPPAPNNLPLWIGGGLVVMVVVFLAAEGGGGGVTVPPIAGGLDRAPAEVVVQTDTVDDRVLDGDPRPADEAPIAVASTPPSAEVANRLDTVPPIRAAVPAAFRPTATPVVITIVPPEAHAAALSQDTRWAKTWVNVRAGRSGSSEAVRVLNPGDIVGVDSLGRGWYRVSVDGVAVGYVDHSLLAQAPPDSLPG